MARYCCYCGSLLLTEGRQCETCGRTIVLQPPAEEGAETDESDSEEPLSAASFVNPRQIRDLTAPPHHQDMVYGFIERFRQKHVHTFHFCCEADNSLVLAATMASSLEGPVFLHTRSDLNGAHITLADVPKRKGQPGFVAVLIPSTILGNEFVVTTKEEGTWTDMLLKRATTTAKRKDRANGANSPGEGIGDPPDRRTQLSSSDAAGRELGLFAFDANLLGAHPNKVTATVRANPTSLSAAAPIKARMITRNKFRAGADQSLFERLQGKRDRSYRSLGREEEEEDEIATFETKKPHWNESVKGWTLDFNGRVTISSKKNFILIPSELDEMMFGAETTAVRFGKVAKHKFNLDYRFPFSPVTALAAAISMFTSKLVVAW